MSHLDEVRLEQLAIGAAADPHVDTCAECAAKVDALRRDTEFHQYVFPATVDRVVARARGRRWFPAWAMVTAPALAAAAAVVLVVRAPSGPGEDYLGVKGQEAVRLEAFGAGSAGAVPVTDGQRVAANAALRFRVKPPRPCHLWLLSVDSAGAVSRLYPASGDAPARIDGPTDFPGGAVLDGSAGAERFFAVCTEDALGWPDVERAARETRLEKLGAAAPGSLQVEKVR